MNNECPVCKAPNGKYFIPIGDFKIYKCNGCGLEYTLPIPSEGALKAFYSEYIDTRAQSSVVLKNSARNIAALAKLGYDETKKLLDFGTGGAEFLSVAGENSFGVDFKKIKQKKSVSKHRSITN